MSLSPTRPEEGPPRPSSPEPLVKAAHEKFDFWVEELRAGVGPSVLKLYEAYSEQRDREKEKGQGPQRKPQDTQPMGGDQSELASLREYVSRAESDVRACRSQIEASSALLRDLNQHLADKEGELSRLQALLQKERSRGHSKPLEGEGGRGET